MVTWVAESDVYCYSSIIQKARLAKPRKSSTSGSPTWCPPGRAPQPSPITSSTATTMAGTAAWLQWSARWSPTHASPRAPRTSSSPRCPSPARRGSRRSSTPRCTGGSTPRTPPGHPFNTHGPHECIKFLEYQLYTQNRIPDLDELPDPRLFATHVPFVSLPRSVVSSGCRCRIVYVCRDPKDTLISHWSFANKFRVRDGLEPLSVQAAADYFCDGVSPFGPYWEHVLGYWRAHLANTEQVLFFRYEEMSRDPATHVRRLAGFVGCPFSVEEEEDGVGDAIVKLCSFEHMTGLETTKGGKTELVFGAVENSSFFRRGQVGDWENHLSPETARKIDAITEAKFRGSGLSVLSSWP